ncbi:MAG: AMP-binding protein, partial [Acidobacteriaceae bacterium]
MRFDLKTVNDVFFRAAGAGGERVMEWRDPAGQWLPITGNQLYGRVRAFAETLSSWGIAKGDRVAILAENRCEWPVVDFAVLAIGAVDVPFYSTLTAQQIAGMLADSGARVVVVSTARQYEKIAAIREQTQVERIVVMDAVPDASHAIWFGDLMPKDGSVVERDAEFDRRAYDVKPDDLMTLIYTSGTTGESKGVMLTHGNLAANLNVSTLPFSWDKRDAAISFL